MLFARHKSRMPTSEEALPGRDDPMPVSDRHLVKGTPIKPPFPDGMETAVFGLPEICAELIENFDVPEFEEAWLQYCVLYSASREEQQKALGESLRGNGLRSALSGQSAPWPTARTC